MCPPVTRLALGRELEWALTGTAPQRTQSSGRSNYKSLIIIQSDIPFLMIPGVSVGESAAVVQQQSRGAHIESRRYEAKKVATRECGVLLALIFVPLTSYVLLLDLLDAAAEAASGAARGATARALKRPWSLSSPPGRRAQSSSSSSRSQPPHRQRRRGADWSKPSRLASFHATLLPAAPPTIARVGRLGRHSSAISGEPPSAFVTEHQAQSVPRSISVETKAGNGRG